MDYEALTLLSLM